MLDRRGQVRWTGRTLEYLRNPGEYGFTPASLWEAEALDIYRAQMLQGRPPAEVERELARARERMRAGEMWDFHARQWRARPAGGETDRVHFDPARDDLAARREAYRRRAARGGRAAGAVLALGMAAEGMTEANRVAAQRLEVSVRQERGSSHVFLSVVRVEMRPDGTQLRHRGDYTCPVRQKWLLERWFEGSLGFLQDGGVPGWLHNAEIDGRTFANYDGSPGLPGTESCD